MPTNFEFSTLANLKLSEHDTYHPLGMSGIDG